jgi:hypothetical protein
VAAVEFSIADAVALGPQHVAQVTVGGEVVRWPMLQVFQQAHFQREPDREERLLHEQPGGHSGSAEPPGPHQKEPDSASTFPKRPGCWKAA